MYPTGTRYGITAAEWRSLRLLPENVSTFGADVDGIIQLGYGIVGVWLLLAMGTLLFSCGALPQRSEKTQRITIVD